MVLSQSIHPGSFNHSALSFNTKKSGSQVGGCRSVPAKNFQVLCPKYVPLSIGS